MHLIVQAVLAGAAGLLLFAQFLDLDTVTLTYALQASLVAHLILMLTEDKMAPKGREKEYHRVTSLITKGPFARRHKLYGIGIGVVLPLVLLTFGASMPVVVIASLCALVGLYTEEDILVRAGQALQIS